MINEHGGEYYIASLCGTIKYNRSGILEQHLILASLTQKFATVVTMTSSWCKSLFRRGGKTEVFAFCAGPCVCVVSRQRSMAEAVIP